MINRELYLNRLFALKDQNLIKVLTGIRRTGKSTIMQTFAARLRVDGIKDAEIQAYNFESPRTVEQLGKTWSEIFFSIVDKCQKDVMNYIFLDEIQIVDNYEKIIDGLYVEPNIDLYVTGSNAKLLSSELASLLTGRSIEIHVTPYSLKEYALAKDFHGDFQTLFNQHYFINSQLPGAVNLEALGADIVSDYVAQVYLAVLENDIYPKIKDVNKRMFENVFKFVISNIGSQISPSSITKALRNDNINTTNVTISNYLELLCDSYLLYKVNRFDIKGKQQLATLEKYYVPDLGIRQLLIGQEQFSDRGHLLENLVYFELLRRGGKVWIGKIGNAEIDFVVQKNDGSIEYYQVAWSLDNEDTFAREIRPLETLNDSYAKFIITADLFEGNENGIKIRNFVNWASE